MLSLWVPLDNSGGTERMIEDRKRNDGASFGCFCRILKEPRKFFGETKTRKISKFSGRSGISPNQWGEVLQDARSAAAAPMLDNVWVVLDMQRLHTSSSSLAELLMK